MTTPKLLTKENQMTEASKVYLPFELVPCKAHDFECGGDMVPRYDLPVFTEAAEAILWMSQPANTHIHSRNGKPVRLQWGEYSFYEAKILGFTLPKQQVH